MFFEFPSRRFKSNDIYVLIVLFIAWTFISPKPAFYLFIHFSRKKIVNLDKQKSKKIICSNLTDYIFQALIKYKVKPW